MICCKCQAEINVGHMCDEEEVDEPGGGIYCMDCFSQTDCGQGLHSEDCETTVFETDDTVN